MIYDGLGLLSQTSPPPPQKKCLNVYNTFNAMETVPIMNMIEI